MSNADYTEAQLADLPEYMQENVKDGYAWECACGEMYNNPYAATRCRKCRTYLPEGAKRQALHVVTGEELGYSDFNMVGERVRDTQPSHDAATYPSLEVAHTAFA